MFLCCNCPTIQCNNPVTIRSSQGYCHMVTVIRSKVIADIRDGKRPSRPTDPSQNQWLQDHIWDTITTCWNDKPEQRCELSVVHRIFSMPSSRDILVEFPPVSRKNLIVLVEELLYMSLILPLDPGERAMLRKMQRYISDVISRDIPSTSLSAELGETFRKVLFSS
jgi:hypothetical protein